MEHGEYDGLASLPSAHRHTYSPNIAPSFIPRENGLLGQVLGHTFNLRNQEAEAGTDVACEPEASLVYTMSSRLARVI